jgi:hypothetical protein
MTDAQMFQAIMRPPPLGGVEDWGIPPEVDPDMASDELKVGVS